MLPRKDLELDWKILYQLFQLCTNGYSRNSILRPTSKTLLRLKLLTRYCRCYFSVNSTKEMLDEWKSELFHVGSDRKYISYFCLFLPTLMYPEEHQFGFQLWLDDFMKIWSTVKWCFWEMTSLFCRLAKDASG